MKIVKGKLFKITIGNHTFPVITTDLYRAHIFFKAVFPDQNILQENIDCAEIFFLTETLNTRFKEIKEEWRQMNLLQATPGAIKFNSMALDVLLENNSLILTNSR